uniref:3'-5' exonuclease n=1 Tax=Arcella intermedia TaxID=1963864 RepID=A0A6B2LI15_9EUKA
MLKQLGEIQKGKAYHQLHLEDPGLVDYHQAKLGEHFQWELKVKRELMNIYTTSQGYDKATPKMIKEIERTFEWQYPAASNQLFSLPTLLNDLLASPYIHKVGLESHRDMEKLAKDLDCPLVVRSCHDIKTHPFIAFSESRSLSGLAEIFLGYQLHKKERLTNWENRKLTAAQVTYAATDAWISLQVYNEMLQQVSQ